jgi:hypothetical protein
MTTGLFVGPITPSTRFPRHGLMRHDGEKAKTLYRSKIRKSARLPAESKLDWPAPVKKRERFDASPTRKGFLPYRRLDTYWTKSEHRDLTHIGEHRL